MTRSFQCFVPYAGEPAGPWLEEKALSEARAAGGEPIGPVFVEEYRDDCGICGEVTTIQGHPRGWMMTVECA